MCNATDTFGHYSNVYIFRLITQPLHIQSGNIQKVDRVDQRIVENMWFWTETAALCKCKNQPIHHQKHQKVL